MSCGADVVTSGNHIWDQKETYEFIKNQSRLLRPLNMYKKLPEMDLQFRVKKWFKNWSFKFNGKCIYEKM